MKIGFSLLLWTGHVTEATCELLPKLKNIGYDGVEIPIFDANDPSHYLKVGRIIKDNGLDCTAATRLPDEAHSAISADERFRQGAVKHLRRVIECAHNLGAEILTGPYFQVLGQFTGQRPTEFELNCAAAVHRTIAREAQAAEITCAIEPLNRFEAHLINTMEQAALYVDRVNHPSFGATHDTFHAHIEEKDPVASISTLFATGKLNHVQISENDRGTPGRGHAKLRESIRRLKSLGYDRWLTVEAFGGAVPELAAATRVWRDFFPSPEQVYVEGFQLIRDTWDSA